jgi:hypothetical protein
LTFWEIGFVSHNLVILIEIFLSAQKTCASTAAIIFEPQRKKRNKL